MLGDFISITSHFVIIQISRNSTRSQIKDRNPGSSRHKIWLPKWHRNAQLSPEGSFDVNEMTEAESNDDRVSVRTSF